MNRIKFLREEKGIYQKDLAKLLNVSVPAINYYENEKRSIDTKTASMLADYFNVSIDYLLGKTDIRNSNNSNSDNYFYICPVYGRIAAGEPILAEQYIEGYLPVDPNIYGMNTPEEYFYLKVNGESMNLKIHNGDYALIHKQDYAEDGNIVVAIVNGDEEATLKRYKRINEEIVMLEPMSTLPMEPIVINLKETPFKIIGKAIGQFGKF